MRLIYNQSLLWHIHSSSSSSSSGGGGGGGGDVCVV